MCFVQLRLNDEQPKAKSNCLYVQYSGKISEHIAWHVTESNREAHQYDRLSTEKHILCFENVSGFVNSFCEKQNQYNKWSISAEKDIQHHYPSGKCKSKPQ